MASTYDRLKKIVIEQLGVDEAEVTPEASFVDDLNANSLDLVEVIMSLEEEFGTEISDEDAEKIRTVGDAVEYIDERASERRSPGRDAPGRRADGAPRATHPRSRPAGAGARPQQLAPRAPRRCSGAQRTAGVPRGRGGQPCRVRVALSAPPADDEGVLSARRAAIVSTPGLARLAVRLDLGSLMYLGEGEAQRGARVRPSLLASAFEALVGAIYLEPRLGRRPGLDPPPGGRRSLPPTRR